MRRGSLQLSWLWDKLTAIWQAGWRGEVGPRHGAAPCHGETTGSSAHPQPIPGRGEHWAQGGYSLTSSPLHPQASRVWTGFSIAPGKGSEPRCAKRMRGVGPAEGLQVLGGKTQSLH